MDKNVKICAIIVATVGAIALIAKCADSGSGKD